MFVSLMALSCCWSCLSSSKDHEPTQFGSGLWVLPGSLAAGFVLFDTALTVHLMGVAFVPQHSWHSTRPHRRLRLIKGFLDMASALPWFAPALWETSQSKFASLASQRPTSPSASLKLSSQRRELWSVHTKKCLPRRKCLKCGANSTKASSSP